MWDDKIKPKNQELIAIFRIGKTKLEQFDLVLLGKEKIGTEPNR